jgi:hypothetical protein
MHQKTSAALVAFSGFNRPTNLLHHRRPGVAPRLSAGYR